MVGDIFKLFLLIQAFNQGEKKTSNKWWMCHFSVVTETIEKL